MAKVLRITPHVAHVAIVGVLHEAASSGECLPQVFVRVYALLSCLFILDGDEPAAMLLAVAFELEWLLWCAACLQSCRALQQKER